MGRAKCSEHTKCGEMLNEHQRKNKCAKCYYAVVKRVDSKNERLGMRLKDDNNLPMEVSIGNAV